MVGVVVTRRRVSAAAPERTGRRAAWPVCVRRRHAASCPHARGAGMRMMVARGWCGRCAAPVRHAAGTDSAGTRAFRMRSAAGACRAALSAVAARWQATGWMMTAGGPWQVARERRRLAVLCSRHPGHQACRLPGGAEALVAQRGPGWAGRPARGSWTSCPCHGVCRRPGGAGGSAMLGACPAGWSERVFTRPAKVTGREPEQVIVGARLRVGGWSGRGLADDRPCQGIPVERRMEPWPRAHGPRRRVGWSRRPALVTLSW